MSSTGTHLKVRFVNSQNLEYGNMNDKHPNFGYRCGMCLTKMNNLLSFILEEIISFLYILIIYYLFINK